MSEEEAKPVEQEARGEAPRSASLFRNYLSFAGSVVVAASLVSILLLFLIELTSERENPYLGILTYMILPGFLLFGIGVVVLGMLLERRRRRRSPESAITPYPVLDLNDPRRRRNFFAITGLVFIFIFMSAFGSFRAYEHTESVSFCGESCHSVMKPEFTAFQVAPHARIRCVDCHVGEGAEWYVRSKLNGVRQLYGVVFNSYSKPIKTPVHNMRPARDTCAHCHWPEKFFGDELKVLNRYGYDERNSVSRTRMLVHVGGGSPEAGAASGIHWHMNLANEVTYIASDEHRQVIPWVRLKDRDGNITEYVAKNSGLTPEQIARAPKRTMDCIDCHNRPTHIYLPPDQSVNEALSAGKLDASLPFLKRQAVAALSGTYSTEDEALKGIANSLDEFYRTNYADLYSSKRDSIKTAVTEVQRIYRTYSFPEMKTDWQTHPNNIGHYYFQGCFRCHDGNHVSLKDGKTIRNDCNICHTVLDQTNLGQTVAAKDGAFQHPVDLGDKAALNCAACHKGNGAFQHPVNLGDISRFKCADCHSGKEWGRSRL